MAEEKYEEKVYRTVRSVLGVSDERILTAILLLRDVRRMLGDKANLADGYELLHAMYRQCDRYGRYRLENPVQDREIARELYYMTGDLEQIDWGILLSKDESEHLHISYDAFNLMSDQVEPDTKSVLIAEGQRFVPFLKDMVDRYSYCNYLITVEKDIHAVLLEEIFKDYPQVSVEQTSIYRYEFLQEKFDLILSVPAMGRRNRVDEQARFICRDYETVALENLLLHLSPGGKLLIVMPAKVTFGGGRIADLRNFIQDMYCLETISELPAGIFSGTAVKTHLLSISTGKTDDVTIRRYGFEQSSEGGGRAERKMVLLDDSFVVSSELTEQGDWSVDKLFARQDEDWQQFMERDSRIKLREVAQVFRGKNIARKDNAGNVGVINISNIGDYAIDYDNLDHISETERKLSNYMLEDGDVLLTARGTATRVAVFHQQDYPCIASSNIVVIRPRQDLLDSLYLKMFLDSPLGGKILASAQQGTVVVNLSFKDLQEIEIPLPRIEEQKTLTDEYKRELELYTATVKAAEERWSKTLVKLQSML